MKNFGRFILTIGIFFLLTLLLLMGMWRVVIWTRPSLCANEKAEILVMGNSRIQFGFDDRQMGKVWNVGLNADNYNVVFWKLKMLRKYNPQVKKLILGVDCSIIFEYFSGVEYKLHPYYWDVMNLQDWISLMKYDRTILMYPFDWMKILYPIKSIYSIVSFSDLGIGSYTDLYRHKLEEALEEERKANEKNSYAKRKPMVNALQIEYLNQIIDYCKLNNIAVEFINMPSYPTERTKFNNKILNLYVRNAFPDILFHDYELLELPDSCYGDISHINFQGAKFLSDKFQKDLLE